MSIGELSRFELFIKLAEKTVTQAQVANTLGISTRQVKPIS